MEGCLGCPYGIGVTVLRKRIAEALKLNGVNTSSLNGVILHGADTRMGSEEDSLKIFLLLCLRILGSNCKVQNSDDKSLRFSKDFLGFLEFVTTLEFF